MVHVASGGGKGKVPAKEQFRVAGVVAVRTIIAETDPIPQTIDIPLTGALKYMTVDLNGMH